MRIISYLSGLVKIAGLILILGSIYNPSPICAATPPNSDNVEFAWEANPDPTVVGYRVYYGTASENYSSSISLGNVTTATISNLTSGVTYYFAVTAYDATGQESDFSDEVSFTPESGLPTTQLHFTTSRQAILSVQGLTGHVYEIQATQDFTTWTAIGTVTLDGTGSVNFTDPNTANFPQRFYRIRDTQP